MAESFQYDTVSARAGHFLSRLCRLLQGFRRIAVTRTGYVLFAPGDFLAYNDQRPRTEIREICDVEVSRTYRAYPTNALGQAQEIEERAAFAGSPYGHVSNPRTVKTYYASTAALPLPGRLATVVYPGGKTETYGYEYGTFNASTFAFTPDPDGGAWRETVTTTYPSTLPSSLLALPSRSVRVWDERGREVLNESYAADGASFALIGWTRLTYDRSGKLVETATSDGRIVTATWGANCCGKESETSAEGSITVYGYNELKQKVSETKKGLAADGSGDITTLYTYDLANRVLSTAVTNIASGLGYVASLNAYDAVGRLTNAVDRLGNATTCSYPGAGDRQVAPNGITTLTERYLDGGQTKRILENGVVKQSYAYGVNSDGARWTLSADGSLPAAIRSTLELPNFSTLELLDFPWQLQATDPLGRSVATYKPGFGGTVLVTSNAYDTADNILSATQYATSPNPVNHVILSKNFYSYAADGSLYLSALDLNTNGVIDLSGPDRITGTSAAYEKDASDTWWQVSRSWVYPEFNSSSAVTTSIQRTQLTGLGMAQGDDGVLASHSEALDVRGNATVTEAFFDRTARRVTQVTALPTSVHPQIQITANGFLLQTVSSTAVMKTFGYDALGREAASTDGRGNTTVTAYNSQGLVAYTEDAASNRTSYAYDALGRRIAVIDALDNVTHTEYDADGRVTKTWGATYPVEYGYDLQGRMISMKTFRDENGQGDETRWLYDNPTGLLTNKLYADSNGPSYTYTPAGQLATRTWARLDPGTGEKLVTLYVYDAAGSLFGVDYSDATPDVAYTYDRLGNKLSAVSSVSTNLFAYSPETLEVISETQNGTVVTRSVDGVGRFAGVGVGEGYAVTYGYDDLGRFASVSSSVCSVSSMTDYSHLPGTDIISGYTSGPLAVTKTYEPQRDLITSVSNHVNHVNPVLISAYDYANDALGRRISRQDSGLAFAQSQANTFGYNQRSEVTSAVMYTNAYGYVYDPIGNRLVSSHNAETNIYVANNLNQYVNIDGRDATSPTYDTDGNMTDDGKEWHYVWDGENRLVLASNTAHVVTYAYDYLGRMVLKAVSLANASSDKQTVYAWNDYNIIVEQIVTDGTTNRIYNVWGIDLSGALQGAGGVGGLLAVNKNGTDFFPAYDASGNVTEYILAAGDIAEHHEYGPFGNTEYTTLRSSSTNEPPNLTFTFWWSTKPWDSFTKKSQYEHRQYDSGIGRWLNRDPYAEVERGLALSMLEMKGTRIDARCRAENGFMKTVSDETVSEKELYLFVENNPVCNFDFLGYSCESDLNNCLSNADKNYNDCRQRGAKICSALCTLKYPWPYQYRKRQDCFGVCDDAYGYACKSQRACDKQWCGEKNEQCKNPCYDPKTRYRLCGSGSDPYPGK
jgi:YD repeat-containing protein